ncbi:MAG: thioredoxin family protein [bacterium]
MQNSVKVFLMVLLFVPLVGFSAGPTEQLEEGMINPGYEEKPGWFKESFLDIREDIEEANGEGRQLMLYFYQDGCPYCAKLLQDNFGNADIATKTQKYFDTIAINMWGDREVTGIGGESTTEKQFAEQLRVQFTPTLVFLDAKGKVLMRLNGYFPPHKFTAVLDYLGNSKLQTKPFNQYYASLKAEPASGKLHVEPTFLQPPLNLTAKHRGTGRPMLVLFEQKQCKACDELHQEFLRRPEMAAALSNFDVALVDIWSNHLVITPDGKSIKSRDWAKQLKTQYTPSLVFFDDSGKETFRSEAYLRAFHLHAILDYVSGRGYAYQPNFQRFIQNRADVMEGLGIHVDLMN